MLNMHQATPLTASLFVLSLLISQAVCRAADVDFAHDIVPLLKEHCGKCHTGEAKKGKFSLNDRKSLLQGGDTGPAATPGKSAGSLLMERLTAPDAEDRMPPDLPPLPADKIELIRKWIDQGLKWEEGFSFGKRGYEPPLKPRKVTLPPPSAPDRTHPIDRILDAHLKAKGKPIPAAVSDAVFARRAHLDLIGLLPTDEELAAFLSDAASGDRRTTLVRDLLARDVDYAEHWLTFWNDLLRNDYSGTGFITGGRRQISKWLYNALYTNLPYDQFARQLIAPPSNESSGFIEGIRWRGEVSAGQTVEIQFSQSITQSFLGINLKCASCHDSFIDRWTLDEAYGLAAIYADKEMEIHRCDLPTGKKAKAAWLFPELGEVNVTAPKPQRLKELADLMTHPDNGRFTRTIVNRLWHRMMGRGIVHPTDAMQTEPWNADLLDHLANHLAENGYDLRKTLEHIATSQAYQSRSEIVGQGADDHGYHYAGPRARRMTAEQFIDGVWQLTGAAPAKFDAPVTRGKRKSASAADPSPAPPSKPIEVTGQWIWSRADTGSAAAGETVTLRRMLKLQAAPPRGEAVAVISCDNSYTLFVNGKQLHAGDNWEAPDTVSLTGLKAGDNEILMVARNGGSGPNPAGLFFQAHVTDAKGDVQVINSDTQWEWTAQVPGKNGKFKNPVKDWQPAKVVTNNPWTARVGAAIAAGFQKSANADGGEGVMVRASLMKNDFLMRSLGRPHREQIVSVRPAELSTLEAIDLSNGQILADTLARGSRMLLSKDWTSPEAFVRWLYRSALSREPSPQELAAFREALGDKLTETGIQDAIWSVIMLPEFQMVH